VRESIVKHRTRWDRPHVEGFGEGPPALEAQVVEVADSIAYDNHDLQDGLEAGILAPEELERVELWQEAERETRRRCGALSGSMFRKQAVRFLIDCFVTDAINSSQAAIEASGVKAWPEVAGQTGNLVGFSGDLEGRKSALEQFLYSALYMDYRVVRATSSARRFIHGLFEAYVADPRQLPPQHRRWAEKAGLHMAVCDYIAGMTDRYAQDQYMQLFLPYQKL
jgi:dGTPase